MACVKLLLLIALFVTVLETQGQDVEPSFMREDIKREVQGMIQRALLESDEKHVAQIAALREENEFRIQQVKDELSKKHADDMAALRNDFETQNRDLRSRLEMITDIVKQTEESISIDHAMDDNRETQEKSPDEVFDNTNRSMDEANGSSKSIPSYMATKRNRKSAPVSQFGQRYSGQGRHEGSMHDRIARQMTAGSMHDRIARQVTGETRVAFFATMSGDNAHIGVNSDIVFQNAVTNIGNAYNAHHGTFLAPVDGVYVFTCTLITDTKTYAHFMVNGDIVAKFNLFSGDDRWQSSQTIIVHLRQGYDVSVQNTDSDKSFRGDKYSTFGGFLLYEDSADTPAIVG